MMKIETAFSALNIWPSLSRSTSARGDFASNKKFEEDRKIEEGAALLVRKGKGGKKIFKCWTCDEYGHYTSKCTKIEKIIKKITNLEEIDIFVCKWRRWLWWTSSKW